MPHCTTKNFNELLLSAFAEKRLNVVLLFMKNVWTCLNKLVRINFNKSFLSLHVFFNDYQQLLFQVLSACQNRCFVCFMLHKTPFWRVEMFEFFVLKRLIFCHFWAESVSQLECLRRNIRDENFNKRLHFFHNVCTCIYYFFDIFLVATVAIIKLERTMIIVLFSDPRSFCLLGSCKMIGGAWLVWRTHFAGSEITLSVLNKTWSNTWLVKIYHFVGRIDYSHQSSIEQKCLTANVIAVWYSKWNLITISIEYYLPMNHWDVCLTNSILNVLEYFARP